MNLSSPSGVIHSHLIALVRHKQAQMCLQSGPKHYERFLKTFYFSKFSIALLIHSLMHLVKPSKKLATGTASLLWQKCLEFSAKKLFHNIKMPMCMHCSHTVLALILLYGGHCFLVWLPAKVTHSFTHRIRLPASRNNAPPTFYDVS